MGFQDRDYYRESTFGRQNQSQPHSIIFYLIMTNVIIWVLDFTLLNGLLTKLFALRTIDIMQPTQWYRFLTYGFCHSAGVWHILGNMFTLYFLGRSVESRYGGREFLFFYLFATVLGGIYWSGSNYWALESVRDQLTQLELHHASFSSVVGASGAVSAVTILFALNFPRVIILIWGLIPMPAFVLGILIIVMDVAGAQNQNTNIAHSVHLAGAAFALIYYIFKIRFCSVFGHGTPKVRHYEQIFSNKRGDAYSDHRFDYEDDYEDDSYGYAPASKTAEEMRLEEENRKLEEEVDRLLRKISQFGMQSLTPQELEQLRSASQRFKDRR